MALFSRMAVIGVGLIGGSLARVLREKGAVTEVVGIGLGEANLKRGVELGVHAREGDRGRRKAVCCRGRQRWCQSHCGGVPLRP